MTREVVTTAFEVVALVCIALGVGLYVATAAGSAGLGFVAGGFVGIAESFVVARIGDR